MPVTWVKTEGNQGIISDIVTRSAKTRVFDLIDAMSQRKMSDAIRIMDELTELKGPFLLIMAMIGRQFYPAEAKKLKEGSEGGHGKDTGIMPYFIDKTMKQASNFSAEDLKRLAARCTDIDFAVKTGRIDGRLAIELLLMEID